jgi:hypothetical protein
MAGIRITWYPEPGTWHPCPIPTFQVLTKHYVSVTGTPQGPRPAGGWRGRRLGLQGRGAHSPSRTRLPRSRSGPGSTHRKRSGGGDGRPGQRPSEEAPAGPPGARRASASRRRPQGRSRFVAQQARCDHLRFPTHPGRSAGSPERPGWRQASCPSRRRRADVLGRVGLQFLPEGPKPLDAFHPPAAFPLGRLGDDPGALAGRHRSRCPGRRG